MHVRHGDAKDRSSLISCDGAGLLSGVLRGQCVERKGGCEGRDEQLFFWPDF